jgi:hypothetical protein
MVGPPLRKGNRPAPRRDVRPRIIGALTPDILDSPLG